MYHKLAHKWIYTTGYINFVSDMFADFATMIVIPYS